MWEICSSLTTETPEQVIDVILVFLQLIITIETLRKGVKYGQR